MPATDLGDLPSLGSVAAATPDAYFLGEGPLWDPIRGDLLWVDIMAGRVLRGALRPDGSITQTADLRVTGTAGAVAVSRTGEMAVAGRQGILYSTPGGGWREGPVVATDPDQRLNDGKADPAGRFVVGTLTEKSTAATERLVRVESDGELTVLDDDLTLSNGLGWTRDGRRMFNVDSLSRRIFVRDYATSPGTIGARSVFADLDTTGVPDGMTVDAEDHVWVAIWGGGCVLRLDPAGRTVGRVDVPAPHVSSVAFAGPDLRTLVITTARQGMGDDDISEYPLSGKLFTVRTMATGVPPYLLSGDDAGSSGALHP